MSAVLVVARREFQERRFLLVAAVVLAALPHAVYLAVHAWAGARDAEDARTLLGMFVAIAFPASVALAVGSSLIGREMAERRLGFYFSRPISVPALWAGKFLGGAALILFTFLCCTLSVDITSGRGGFAQRNPDVLGFLFLIVVFLALVAHVGSTMYRARSPWLVADIVLAVAFLAALGTLARTIVEAGAIFSVVRHPHHGEGARALEFILAAFVVALLCGAAAQLSVGRTDARRAHAALSVTVWVSALLILGAFAAWQRWLLAGTPAQAGGVGYPFVASPAGEGIFFRGLTGRAGFRPFYLMNAGSGAFLRLSPDGEPRPTFSADGRTAAWISIPEPWEDDHRPRLSVVRMGDGVRLAARIPMNDSMRWHSLLAVHPDGRQAVIAGDGAAGLVDLDTALVGAQVALTHLRAADVLPDGRVRVFHGMGEALVISIWSPHVGSLAETVRLPRAALLTRRGDVAVASLSLREKVILDLAQGTVKSLTAEINDPLPRALLLGDGRVALGMGNEVRITDAAGTTLAVVPVPEKSQVNALREPEPGQLAVGLWSLVLSKRRTLFVDAATGSVLRDEAGLLPAGPQSGPWPQAVPGSLASRLFTDEEGTLLALEPGGRRRIILAAAGGGE